MKIRKRFVVFSIILGIVPVIISTSICIANFNSKSIELIKQNVITAANDQSLNLENFLKQNVINLNIIKKMPVIEDVLTDSNNTSLISEKHNTELLNDILKERKNQELFLIRETLVNKNGIIIASSENEDINKKDIFSSEELERLAHNEVVVTDVIEREDFNNGIKSTIIASPIFFDNQYEGSMISVINIEYFNNMVKDLKFFKTGKIAIMDSSGQVIASSSEVVTTSINEINTPNNLYEKWKKIDFDSNPNGIIEYNINVVEKVGYYSRIYNTGWIVLSGVEWAEFKTPIYKNISNIIIFLIFISILIMTSYAFVINYFSKPMYKLLDVIRKIKQGNYKDRFIYDKDNEIGEIAIAFNGLIDTL